MRQKPGPSETVEQHVREIRRATRKKYSAEEKIRIVLSGLRGEHAIAELCRREGIAESLYYAWSKEFLEAAMKRLALALILFLAVGAPARAGFDEGLAAYERGDYAAAYREFLPLAQAGDASAQFTLGQLYRNGWGVAQYYAEAVKWYRLAAEQGVADAALSLGHMYSVGQGVAQDYAQTAKWYRQAAEQGVVIAQFNLVVMYKDGRGVAQDFVQAHMWANLAGWASERDALARVMTPAQIARAQELARQMAATPAAPSIPPPARKRELESTGSGFAVSKAGHILTNAHVIEGCAEVRAKPPGAAAVKAEVIARDQRGDLALLKSAAALTAVASFREGRRIRQGDAVIAVGFPLHGLLASEANVSPGAVSALSGLRDDARHLQITAPIQPGNSGGPLLDLSGNVVGVVVAKLNALKVAGITGDVPQNVNFAIKAELATGFLLSHGVVTETAPSAAERKPADIGEAAKKFTVLVECWK